MLLASFPNLTRLKISIEPESVIDLRDAGPLIFERLEEIYIWHLHVADGCSCHDLLESLRLPQLRALSLRWLDELDRSFSHGGHPINQSIISFLQKCGSKLRFLDLSNLMNIYYWGQRLRNDMRVQVETVASASPNLRHLVLDSNDRRIDERFVKLLHSHLLSGVHVDVWSESDDALRNEDPLITLLPRIRILDHSLWWIQDLPRLFPPEKADREFDAEPRMHTINGIVIAETPFAIYRDGPRELISLGWDSEGDEDSIDDPDYTTEDAEDDWSESSSEWDDDEDSEI
ncbi:hypothetical protein NLI96_g4237 [Meripilus lineatus]|uniref:Uncharacterized protein n=1 Tax=Meripilus lineatus TaxID=2056292 RepID=A0AAD5VAK8_9APHY|nr:hypothetical protein NLI96_g4237 [Physisporinus lineatus]